MIRLKVHNCLVPSIVHAVALLVLTPLVASAETIQFLDSATTDWLSVSVTPAVPSSSDAIAITVQGSLRNSCYSNEQTAEWRVGSDIFVDFTFAPRPGQTVCLQVMLSFVSTVSIGPLSAGNYTVQAFLQFKPEPSGPAELDATGSQSFSVVNAVATPEPSLPLAIGFALLSFAFWRKAAKFRG